MREKYVFVDQNGKEYTEDSILDIYSNIVLTPRYINAGYFPIEDKFGDVASLKMVYIPESEDGGWYGDNLNYPITLQNDKSTSVKLIYTQNYGQGNRNFYTNKKIPATYAAEFFIEKKFMDNLVKSGIMNVTLGTTTTPTKVTVTNPKTNQSTVFNFRSNNLFRSDTANSSGLYLVSTGLLDEIPWYGFGFHDGYIAANMLTCIYNALNPDKTPLTYAYLVKGTTNPVTNLTTKTTNTTPVGNDLTIDNNATGYRVMGNDYYNYVNHLITDDRQVPYVSTKPSSSFSNDLVLKRSKRFGVHGDKSPYIQLKYNYKNSYDGNDKTGYYGSAAGLALYDSNTGTYNRTSTTLRSGKEGAGRYGSSADNFSGIDNNGRKFHTNYVYNNARNGAGLLFMQGLCGFDPEDQIYTSQVKTTLSEKWGDPVSGTPNVTEAEGLLASNGNLNGKLITSTPTNTSHGQTGNLIEHATSGSYGTNFAGIKGVAFTDGVKAYHIKTYIFTTLVSSHASNPSTNTLMRTGSREHKQIYFFEYKQVSFKGGIRYSHWYKPAGATSFTTAPESTKNTLLTKYGDAVFTSISNVENNKNMAYPIFAPRFYRLAK